MSLRRTTLPREHDQTPASAAATTLSLRLVYARGRRASRALILVTRADLLIGREPPPGG